MRRLILILAALLAVAIASVAGSGLTVGRPLTINLSCSDGTNLDLALDTAAVTQLSNAVTGINLYPAGDPALACSLSQSLVMSSSTFMGIPLMHTSPASASGNPNKDYAVGGGQAAFVTRCSQPGSSPPVPQDDNFALSAHVDEGAAADTATGTFNITIPKCTSSQNINGPTTYTTASHLSAQVDCLTVTGSGATLTATVTKTTNLFANSDEAVFPPTEIAVHVFDSGLPGGMGGTFVWPP